MSNSFISFQFFLFHPQRTCYSKYNKNKAINFCEKKTTTAHTHAHQLHVYGNDKIECIWDKHYQHLVLFCIVICHATTTNENYVNDSIVIVALFLFAFFHPIPLWFFIIILERLIAPIYWAIIFLFFVFGLSCLLCLLSSI